MAIVLRNILLVLIISAHFFVISGCAIISHGRMSKIKANQVDSIQIGTTTKDDIIKLFGKPQQIIYKPGNVEIFVYIHGVEQSFIVPFLLMSVGRTSGKGQTFTVTLQEDAVIDYEYRTDERGMVE